MNPDQVRKVITVIRYSLMFSGINDVIKFHFTRGEHKTFFSGFYTLVLFRLVRMCVCVCLCVFMFEISS